MNKIYKVIYSKVRNCYVVVSELAKNHSRGTKAEHTARKGTALTAALLLALSCVSVMGAPGVEAATTRTDGSNFIGVNRTDDLTEEDNLDNYHGKGATGANAITIGTTAMAGNSTITIGNRNSGASVGSVYVGQGDTANPFTDRGGWVTSVGYNSDATGYGSIAIGSNAKATNSNTNSGMTLTDAKGNLTANPDIQGASVALGYRASAADGSIAIGANSVATAAASTANAKFRDAKASDYAAPTSYVSVGSDTVKRRITNVAAGSDANDVATVGQLSYVEQEAQTKGSWKLTAGKANESTVTAGSTVDFSAGADGNLSVSKDKDSNNVTIGLNKDLTGITSISNQTTSGTTTTGAKIELGTDGKTTISGGDVDVSSNKITSLGSGLTGSKYNATTDANHAANLSDVNSMITTAFKDDTIKANADASNIGANIKKGNIIDSAQAQGASELAWAKALGSGKIADDTGSEEESKRNGSLKLVTGGTVYTELKKGLLPSSTSTQTVVFSDYKTGENLKNLDETTVKYDYDRAGSNTDTLTPDYSTITLWGIDRSDQDKYDASKDYGTGIHNLRSALKDKNGNALTDAGGNKVTIATATGDTLKYAVNLGDLQTAYNLDAHIDASNIGSNFDGDKTTNENAWGTALGTGTITNDESKGSKQLVTGATVYSEVRPSEDGTYVLKTNTTGANLLALDKQVKSNADQLSDVGSRSVKYDTKTENGKTVVDNTKITLAGNGGTTITNLKDGVNDSDAATVGQLNAKISGVTYEAGNGIDMSNKKISAKAGKGITVDANGINVKTGNGLEIAKDGSVAIKTSDSNLKVDEKGIGLSDKVTIGSDTAKQVTIDGTKGEISGLTNTKWDTTADYSTSTKAATESQVAAAVKDAIKQAGDNDVDTHVKADSYGVDDKHQVSMDIVDKAGKATGQKVTITDVAKASEVGDVSTLADGVKNADGSTTTVVDAINNVNTKVDKVDGKVGDLDYSKSNTSGSNQYVKDGDSITSAIGKLDGAVQAATTAAGQHSTVSAGSNITVTPTKQTDGHTDYQVALNKDITVENVTTKTATTDTLTVNNSANIGGVTIENKTISGLDDTTIEKGSTKAANAGTIWNELRPSGGTYINQNNTTAQNLTNLDTQVKKNSDLVNSDGSTIKIGSKDGATKVDISDKNGSGRVVTGVVTDTNDANSAANVGYVNNMAAANTQQIYRDMNNAYGRLENNINRAAAGSNALAALHPLEYDPDDKLSFAMGYGHYHNANAAAVGAFYQPNSKTQFNFGVALGNGDPGFNAGIAFKLGKPSPYAGMNRVTLIHAVQDLKASEEAKDKRIDALEKENQEMKKQLQAIMAKLNG